MTTKPQAEELSDRIRSFLLKNPKPQMVRVVSLDGREHEVRVPTRPRWRDVADTIVSLEPAVMHALDEEGEVLRAEKLVSDPTVTESGSGFREIPIPAALSNDPETLRLTHTANLLERAHEKSNDFVREFGAILLSMVENTQQRLERVETAYRAEHHARLKAEIQGMEEGDSKDEMMKAFFGSYFGGQNQKQESPRPTNGNGERRPPRGWGFGGGDG